MEWLKLCAVVGFPECFHKCIHYLRFYSKFRGSIRIQFIYHQPIYRSPTTSQIKKRKQAAELNFCLELLSWPNTFHANIRIINLFAATRLTLLSHTVLYLFHSIFFSFYCSHAIEHFPMKWHFPTRKSNPSTFVQYFISIFLPFRCHFMISTFSCCCCCCYCCVRPLSHSQNVFIYWKMLEFHSTFLCAPAAVFITCFLCCYCSSWCCLIFTMKMSFEIVVIAYDNCEITAFDWSNWSICMTGMCYSWNFCSIFEIPFSHFAYFCSFAHRNEIQ